jgi:hypothetical protein
MGADEGPLAEFRFQSTVIYWRGPAPFFYAPLPARDAAEVRRLSKAVSYGWGVIPVKAAVAGVRFTTSLFPKDETYLLPLKVAVRRKTNVTAGDVIDVEMSIAAPARERWAL